MFSDVYYKTVYFWANWVACPLGAIPFKFDKKCRRLYTTGRSKQRCIRIWLFLAFNNLTLVGLMVYFKKSKEFNNFNHAYLGWVISSIWCLCHGSLALQPTFSCCVFNSFHSFFERYKERFMPLYNPNNCSINRKIDLFCFMIRWGCFMLAVLETTHFILFARNSPFYLDFYIPDEYYNLPVYLCTLWFHFSIFMVTSINMGFSSMYMVSNTLHMAHIISEDIRCGLRYHSFRTLAILRTGPNMQIIYRSLELIHKLQMEAGSVLLYPMNWLMLKMIVICGANLIKYHQFMVPVVKYTLVGWALSGLIVWGTVLELGGYLFQYSQRALTSWKHHDWGEDNKIMSKFKKSCRPMKVSYHKVFSIKRVSVLKFFRSVAKGLFKAFVAL